MNMLVGFSKFTRYAILINLVFWIGATTAVASGRVATGLVAYYPFTERAGKVISDQSGSDTPMDLVMSGAADWRNKGDGVVMYGGRIGTSSAASPMINALQASNTITIEAWVRPENLTQTGPTRIVSLANSTNGQNFMLGQDLQGVQARVMNDAKDAYGVPWLSTGNDVFDGSRVHLVHTFDGAVERMYVDGVLRSETVAVSGSFSSWDTSAVFSIGNESSLDRPFSGSIFLVAIYDRALGDAEVQQNFVAGAEHASNDAALASYAPVISGTPGELVVVDQFYMFQPNASDRNGDTLTFSIANKPGWASFDVTTGSLVGIPRTAVPSVYNNIVISVTDGIEIVELPAFTIQVVAASALTGSIDLGWVAPVARADGTAIILSEIDGYKIYYGTASEVYPDSVYIKDANATSAVLTGLPIGTWYVAITTIDINGQESVYSSELVKLAQ